jgi:hypothetical protein
VKPATSNSESWGEIEICQFRDLAAPEDDDLLFPQWVLTLFPGCKLYAFAG